MLIHLGDGGLCRLRHKVVFIKKRLAFIFAFLISINLNSTESFVIYRYLSCIRIIPCHLNLIPWDQMGHCTARWNDPTLVRNDKQIGDDVIVFLYS